MSIPISASCSRSTRWILSETLDLPVPSETVEALHWAMQAAGVEYPTEDAQTALVAGPFGIRGVSTSLCQRSRTRLGRRSVDTDADRMRAVFRLHSLSVASERPSHRPSRLKRLRQRDLRAQPLFGTEVTLFSGLDAEKFAALRTELAGFTDATGIVVRLVGTQLSECGFDYVADSIAAGIRPMSRRSPIPVPFATSLVRVHLIDLGTYLDIERLRRDQSPYLISLGTLGEDGSWPASTGTTYGAFSEINLKSMIWYPIPELARGGPPDPRTWNELMALSDALVREAEPPGVWGGSRVTPTGGPAPTGSSCFSSTRPDPRFSTDG